MKGNWYRNSQPIRTFMDFFSFDRLTGCFYPYVCLSGRTFILLSYSCGQTSSDRHKTIITIPGPKNGRERMCQPILIRKKNIHRLAVTFSIFSYFCLIRQAPNYLKEMTWRMETKVSWRTKERDEKERISWCASQDPRLSPN